MIKPDKMFHVKIARAELKPYDFRVKVSEFDGEKETEIGVQYFKQDETEQAIGALVEGLMGDYADYDPIFVMYRDRSQDEALPKPKRHWSKFWGWIEDVVPH